MGTHDEDDEARQNEVRRAVEDWESEGGAQRFEQHNLASGGVAADADPPPLSAIPVVREGEQGD